MNGNNIRSPNYFIARWFFIFGLVFTAFLFSCPVSAGVSSLTVGPVEAKTINSFLASVDKTKTNYIIKRYIYYKDDDLVCDYLRLAYTDNSIFLDDDKLCTTSLTLFDNYYWYTASDKYNEWEGSNNSLEPVKFSSSNEGSIRYGNKVVVSVVDCNVVSYSSGSSKYENEVDYDFNDLNTYPPDTINVVSPVDKIKTNSKYYTFSFKGKIKLGENDIEENVTPQIISKFIRNKFRYDFKSDKENLTGLSCLGAFKIDKEYSFTDEVMLQNFIDGKITFHNEKYDVTDFVDDFVCGVSGNYKEWNSKGYYNFIVNTSVYIGDSPGTNEYKFYFTVPYKFNGIFSYKTITVNYSLSRGLYVDENFDGLDDETTEVIPDSEIDIIYPDGFFYPSFSTSTPSNNTFNDGDVIQNNNNNIVLNNSSDVSKKEQNGILNMLDDGFRTTTGRFKSLNESFSGFKNTMSGIFSFFPSDVQNILFLSVILMSIFFILGLRR